MEVTAAARHNRSKMLLVSRSGIAEVLLVDINRSSPAPVQHRLYGRSHVCRLGAARIPARKRTVDRELHRKDGRWVRDPAAMVEIDCLVLIAGEEKVRAIASHQCSKVLSIPRCRISKAPVADGNPPALFVDEVL